MKLSNEKIRKKKLKVDCESPKLKLIRGDMNR
jgi:hypothetical protein